MISIAAAAGAAALLYGLVTREAAPSQDLPFTSYTATSKSIELLAALDEGAPSATLGETFGLTSASVTVSAASPLIKGEVLLKILCMSVDPYLRGGIKSINGLTGAANEPCPRVMSGFVAGIVIASNDAAWAVGDRFGAHLPFATVQRAFLGRTVAWKLTGLVGSNDANISYGVGVLGMPGATAYGGLTGVLRPREEKKETILITAAAGAVGSLVGQIAKQVYGATVIGTAGGPGKVHTLLSKYDFDYAIDRKALPDQAEDGTWRARKEALIGELKTAAPHGIDMVFENVGQDHFEAAFESLAPKGRIAVCGQIAAYNDNRCAGVCVCVCEEREEACVCVCVWRSKRAKSVRPRDTCARDRLSLHILLHSLLFFPPPPPHSAPRLGCRVSTQGA